MKSIDFTWGGNAIIGLHARFLRVAFLVKQKDCGGGYKK